MTLTEIDLTDQLRTQSLLRQLICAGWIIDACAARVGIEGNVDAKRDGYRYRFAFLRYDGFDNELDSRRSAQAMEITSVKVLTMTDRTECTNANMIMAVK